MYYAKDLVHELKQARQIVVFGAGIMALGVVSCLMEPPYCLNLKCCLVSDKKGNPDLVAGVPVLDFQEAEGKIEKDVLVVIAAVDKNLASMEKSLHDQGYIRLISLTYEGDLWSLIRGNLYQEWRKKEGKPYLTLEEELGKRVESAWEKEGEMKREAFSKQGKVVHVYRACCHVDRRLKEDLSRYSWEIPIQAGAGLTGERICEICDDTGEHISYKNRQYCELTALYWIWKNDRSDYVGLSHYRRHFEVNEKDLETLADSDIDVVLTIPIFDVPSVERVYQRDHVEADWQVMMEGMKTLCPEYLKAARELSKGRFYYAYNMFLMRREILEKYCQWLFPLLFYCEERCSGRERDSYQGRYIGFLAEHLMSIYFLYHEKEYKVVHARKHFVEW